MRGMHPSARFGSGCGVAPVAPLPPPRRTPIRNEPPLETRPSRRHRNCPPLEHHQCAKVRVSQLRKSSCLLTPSSGFMGSGPVRTAKVKLTLTKRTVETLQPADKPWIAWDDRLSGFGLRGARPALGGEGVHRQLPHRKRRTQSAEPPRRHRAMRPPGARGGAPPRPGAAGTRRPGRGSRAGAGGESAACRPSERRSRST